MNTENHQESDVHLIIDQAFSVIEKVHCLMSFHEPDSDLTKLNKYAYLYGVEVHPYTYAVFVRAQRIFKASQGLFDCTVARTLVEWDMLPKIANQTPSPHATQADIQLLKHCKIQYKKKLWVDLGGIAKGFAVDLAIHILKNHGIKQMTVNAGGDLRVFGGIEEIFIRDPHSPRNIFNLGQLSNGAIATSAGYFSEKNRDNVIVNALIDPRNSQPVTLPKSYSVISPLAYLSDALTKVVAVSGQISHPCLSQFGAQAIILEA